MRYIDADKLIDDLEHDIAIDQDHILYVGIDMREKELIQFDKDCKQNCIDILSKAPTADVRENVPGKWWHEPHTNNTWVQRCSNCFQIAMITVEEECPYNFCPNCGADMRGEKNEI